MMIVTTVIALLLTFASAEPETAANVPLELKLWPGPPPGEDGKAVGPEMVVTGKRSDKTIVSLRNVTSPALFVYPAPEVSATGAAAVIFPGGGYDHLDWTEEGEEVAEWLNSIGITAVILKYRVGYREGRSRSDYAPAMALMDAQRALSFVRANASGWNVDPSRVGVIGFSAGGHLGAWVSTSLGERSYEPVDKLDEAGCSADFAVILYPYGIINFDSKRYDANLPLVKKGVPPTFLVVASDDDFCVDNATAYYRRLTRKGIPAELHAYETGGHSFALRATGKPSAAWPKRCEEWMRNRGLLKAAGSR
ncbi:alpha/beta hydrolase [Isosphaeraceae bacterium EP7]